MAGPIGIGLGEILWDVLPDGKSLGGAPANFAYHVNALGGTGIPLSRVGDDDLGHQAMTLLKERAIPTEYISVDPIHPTGTVNASIDGEGVATYAFPDNVAWDFLAFDAMAMALAESADLLCFGTLAQRSETSRASMRSLIRQADKALTIYDINLREDFFTPEIILDSLALADVLKINDEELYAISRMFHLPENEEAALEALLKTHGLDLAVLTRGARGSLIVSPHGRSDLPGVRAQVQDTIGAGDAFTAAMGLAYLADKPLDDINRYASHVAAHVCAHTGAMPDMPESLRLI